MSDIPQLERALVEAARRRARRSWRPPRWAVVTLTAAAAAVVAALVVRAAGPDLERSAEPAPPTGNVDEVLGRVFQETQDDPSCQPVGATRGRLIPGEPSAATAGAFAVLRRPAGDRDRYRRAMFNSPLAAADVLAGSIRGLRASDGTRYLLAISRGRWASHLRDPEACRGRRLELFDRLAGRLSGEDARRGREQIALTARDDPSSGPDQEHVELYRLNRDLTVNEAWTEPVERVRTNGIYLPRMVIVGGELETSIGGLVPDGVAAAIVRSRDREGKASTQRVAVRGNLLQVTLPRGAEPDVTITWLDAAGRELRQVPFTAG
jgi:hypothetical protein